jgi:hypothetical protein
MNDATTVIRLCNEGVMVSGSREEATTAFRQSIIWCLRSLLYHEIRDCDDDTIIASNLAV